jgi:hypothetical protein
MASETTATDGDNDDLICPITMQVFRDPVLAGDGRVYEREAISRWILEHGTSPFTREPLQLDQFQPDDHLRQLALKRRNSSVSYNAQTNTVILPPLRNTRRIYPEIHPDPMAPTDDYEAPIGSIHCKCCKVTFAAIYVAVFVVLSVIVGIVIAVTNMAGKLPVTGLLVM